MNSKYDLNDGLLMLNEQLEVEAIYVELNKDFCHFIFIFNETFDWRHQKNKVKC
jgi:hypothetical protein